MANSAGGAVSWYGTNGTLTDSTFNNNQAGPYGGAVFWYGTNGTLTDSTFSNNNATDGGGLWWSGDNSKLINSIFTNNIANSRGGAIAWACAGIISDITFDGNTVKGWAGGSIFFFGKGAINNCNFINSKWINTYTQFNGIYALDDLTINGGKGILDLFVNGTLSGISVVVLNNETYYYPPNANIKFHKQKYA
ncbi:hypothetical protein [uncultured Methanobrevibacter sp.]|uniref:hypothetical protein n=1 Tax=uncultured Methanobrevibacter sp. TaxID=253161 RepID=UPI0034CEB3B4